MENHAEAQRTQRRSRFSPRPLRLCVILFLLGSVAAQPNREEGMVLENDGRWQLNGKLLKAGDAIPFNAEIAPAARAGPIVIWYSTGRVVLPPCVVPCRPKAPEKARGGANFFAAAGALFKQDPQRYALAVSRSLERDPQEAVIALTAPQVDLSPVFANLPAGSYAVQGASVQWTPRGSAMIPAAPFHAGLMKLRLLHQGGDPNGSEVWVLFATPATYASRSAAFQEAVQTTTAWGDDVDPATARALLRAYLTSLAESKR